MKPPCFDTDGQWALWQRAAQLAHTPMAAHTHCLDCTPAYQARMVRAGRCENPTFSFDPPETSQSGAEQTNNGEPDGNTQITQ